MLESDELGLEEAVGDGSLTGTLPPVEATKAIDELVVASLWELLGTTELALEDAVGDGSLVGTLPPVEATK